MHHSEIINQYIKKYKLQSYLEIGTRHKYDNFNKIKCREKFCIDPDSKAEADFELTSDEFFKINHKKFDCIFVDGLHEGHQVYKDIKNGIKFLNEGGVILCHDVNPKTFNNGYDFEDYNGSGEWNGDSWKGFVKYRFETPYYTCTIKSKEADVGIIDTNLNTDVEKCNIKIGELTYEILDEHRQHFLNIINNICEQTK